MLLSCEANVTSIQFVHSTQQPLRLHSITHVTHVQLTQIRSTVSFGDKHQSPEDGDSLNKRYGSLQSSKSTIISSEQPETWQIYIYDNTPSSCYWSVSNLQKKLILPQGQAFLLKLFSDLIILDNKLAQWINISDSVNRSSSAMFVVITRWVFFAWTRQNVAEHGH